MRRGTMGMGRPNANPGGTKRGIGSVRAGKGKKQRIRLTEVVRRLEVRARVRRACATLGWPWHRSLRSLWGALEML